MQAHLHTSPGCLAPAVRRCRPPLPGLLARPSALASQGGPGAHNQGDVDYKRIANASVVAAVVFTLVSGSPGAAHAHTGAERVWKPRRHYRRMGERISDNWAEEAVEAEQALLEERMAESQRNRRLKLQQEEESFQRMKIEQQERIQRAEKMLTKVEALGSRTPFSVKVGDTELFPLLFWGTVGALVLWVSGALIQRSQRQNQGKGKFVYDRSLGGKKVWVPDASAPGAATATVAAAVRTDEFDRLMSVAAAARQKQDQGSKEFSLPSWWNLPPTSFASPELREAKQLEADRLLTRIEQAKNRGDDYSIADILSLRAICQEGGVSVRPGTVGARDAIYKTAVDEAVACAQDRLNPEHTVGDQESEFPETRLLTALAGDINMPEERAVSMIKSAVASACRARLLDALKFLKANNELDALVALMRLNALLENLPAMAEGAVEPELIASSLRDTSSLEERQKIFYIVGQLSREAAGLFAEMLGFDPALVVPKLLADMNAYKMQKAGAFFPETS